MGCCKERPASVLLIAFVMFVLTASPAVRGGEDRDLPPSYNYLHLAECLENFREREFFEVMHRMAHVEKTGEAWFILGLLHHHGLGTPVDLERAAHWYRRADAAGYDFPHLGLEAARGLRELEAAGVGGVDGSAGEMTALEVAAAAEGPAAMLRMGTRYLQGLCAPLDWDRSREWEIRAANGGDPEAARIVRLNYQYGLFAYPVDPGKAPPPPEPLAALLNGIGRAVADDGKAAGPKNAGAGKKRRVVDIAADMYREGMEAWEKEDYFNAGLHFCEASSFGVLEADNYYRLAWIQEHGLCGDVNLYGAGMAYRIGAELGHVEAMYRLGRLHESGEGVRRSAAEAAKWYEAAVGVAEADTALRLLRRGGGASEPEEWERSPVFKRLLAEARFRASFNHSPYRFPDEMRRATEYLVKAAKDGLPQARYLAGLLYLDGYPEIDIAADPVAARRWLSEAAAAGVDEARARLDALGWR